MLVRVLGVASDALNQVVVDNLLQLAVVEYQRLEYKSQLPGTTSDDRREFARDVASMANGGGGVIVIGIADDANDAAHELTPVALGPEVTRLRQICTSLIEPMLRVEFHEVPMAGGQEGVIAVEIPVSQRRPYAVLEGARLGYYMRAGKSRHPMSETEVARMYAARFERVGSVADRTAELVSQVEGRAPGRNAPAVYLAIAPVEAYERLFRPDRETMAGVRNLQVPPVFGTDGVGTVLPTQLRPGFKRIDLARDYEPNVIERYGWMEFHDDGAFLVVIPGDERLDRGLGGLQGEVADVGGFYDARLTCQVVAALKGFGELAEHFGVAGELVVVVGISPLGLPAVVTTGPGRYEADHTTTVVVPVQTQLSIDTDQLMTMTGVLEVAAPLLDDLMTAFGWPRCMQIERDGTIVLRTWGQGWIGGIERWAEANDLPTRPDPSP